MVCESLVHISHLLLSIFVLLHLSCGWAINAVPPGLNRRRDLWSIIGLRITDLFDSPPLLVHSIVPSPSKPCLVVLLCSSSSRPTSCLSSRAWLSRWPLCRWAWASQPSPPSPPPLVSSPSPPCWPLKPSWPRRRKRLVTGSTATARRTERSPISRRSCSDTSHLSPHFAYSVSVTTNPRPAVSHWEHFDLVTVLLLLYLLLFDTVSCFLLVYHTFFYLLFQPVFPSFPPLCTSFRCATSLPAKLITVLNVKSVTNKNPLLLASNLHEKTLKSTRHRKKPTWKNYAPSQTWWQQNRPAVRITKSLPTPPNQSCLFPPLTSTQWFSPSWQSCF